MAISETVVLPNQPVAAGNVKMIALGGNGFVNPKHMYVIKNFALAGDASGGLHTLTLVMDPTWCSMIQFAQMGITQATAADIETRWTLVGPDVAVQIEQRLQTKTAATLNAQTITDRWLPQPQIMPGTNAVNLSIAIPNVEDDTLSLNCQIFLYDIRAREVGQYGHLVDARGGV